MSFFTRLSKAIQAFFSVLGGAQMAVPADVHHGAPGNKDADRSPAGQSEPEPAWSPAVAQLLGAFQREGRLVDFLMEDLNAAGDAEIGAAARVVHRGCRKVMDSFFQITPVWPGEEGAQVTVEAGYDPRRIDVLGASGPPPIVGTLAHGGWCLRKVNLPVPTAAFQLDLIQKAEVEK